MAAAAKGPILVKRFSACIAALIAVGFPEQFVRTVPEGAKRDDFLDACAALWTAARIYRDTAKRIPAIIERDARGLDMTMWV